MGSGGLEPFEHQVDYGDMHPGFTALRALLICHGRVSGGGIAGAILATKSCAIIGLIARRSMRRKSQLPGATPRKPTAFKDLATVSGTTG